MNGGHEWAERPKHCNISCPGPCREIMANIHSHISHQHSKIQSHISYTYKLQKYELMDNVNDNNISY